MTESLLDVNVLIALIDPAHVHHDRAHEWFGSGESLKWLSSPVTQNGVLRIVSNPRYANHQPLQLVIRSLRSLLTVGSHRFIPDSISVPVELDAGRITGELTASAQLTDTYLLALASAHGAKLATFDVKLQTSTVVQGADAIVLIP